MSTPWSWSRGGGRQADEVRWGQKVTEMGWGTDKDKKGKKGGCTMTSPPSYAATSQSGIALLRCQGWCTAAGVWCAEDHGERGSWGWTSAATAVRGTAE